MLPLVSTFKKHFRQLFSPACARLAKHPKGSWAFRHHLAITGTGRAGTTFLIQLFTELGFETGFSDLTSNVFNNCNAGMEKDIRDEDAPYVVKDPTLCSYLDEFLNTPSGANVVIDYLIVPVRDLHSAAESRRDVSRRTDPALYGGAPPPGGVWLTDDPNKQEVVLQNLLYQIIFAAAKWNIPVILLHFPRTVRDTRYLYEKLQQVLGGITYSQFCKGFANVARPELVHDFKKDAQASMAA